jgi:hypothetical protein
MSQSIRHSDQFAASEWNFRFPPNPTFTA